MWVQDLWVLFLDWAHRLDDFEKSVVTCLKSSQCHTAEKKECGPWLLFAQYWWLHVFYFRTAPMEVYPSMVTSGDVTTRGLWTCTSSIYLLYTYILYELQFADITVYQRIDNMLILIIIFFFSLSLSLIYCSTPCHDSRTLWASCS